MHHKEKVIGPLIAKALGVVPFIAPDFDSDVFGTFTGEIARTQDALQTVRNKCLAAMKIANCDLGIATEGSFGAHPSSFFAQANDELVIFIDRKNDLEIVGRTLSFATNFSGATVNNTLELFEFAEKVGFPEHGLILKPTAESTEEVYKGIVDKPTLETRFTTLQRKYGQVYVETDMRAMYNPTRMQVIASATEKLIQNIQSHCPQCDTPGFVITNSLPGLRCSWCGNTTSSTLSHIYNCKKCQFSKEVLYPNDKQTEDPGFCNYCNP
jgi:hypothetical protein